MSIIQLFSNMRKTGFRQFWRDLNYIGTTKAGTLRGEDGFGNLYYENAAEIPGRHRWVSYAQHDFNGSQVPPEWHAWLNHIRKDPPHEDPIVIKAQQKWQLKHLEDITGTRGAYKTYSTTAPKISAWQGSPAQR